MKTNSREITHVDCVPFTFLRPAGGLVKQGFRLLWVSFLTCACHPVSADEPVQLDGDGHRNHQVAGGHVARKSAPVKKAKFELPPLPAGVAEHKFSEFFVKPIGSRGLELTEKLSQLDGRRVRILGYMVQQEEAPPGRLLLAPMPAQIHEHDNGLAEDIPATMVFASVSTLLDSPVPHVPGLMLLTGTLSVGGRPEPDGRVSLVRLPLDPPGMDSNFRKFSAPRGKGAERLISSISQKQNPLH